MRLRLDLSYDGTGFSGWAVQPRRRTVAGVLSEALSVLFRVPVPMVVAGRTDAGVHATGQVAHIDVDRTALAGLAPRHLRVQAGGMADLPAGSGPESITAPGGGAERAALTGLLRRLAGLLPADVRVRAAGVAPTGFDARFSALRRHYRYRIAVAEWGVDPLRRADTLWWRRALDVQGMQQAADALVGLRDFAAFCKPREGATTIRDLQRLAVTADALPTGAVTAAPSVSEGMVVLIDVTADAFCHSMVRGLVGALLAVGDGRDPVSRPAELLSARRRTASISVAPALGLTLIGVDYPPDIQLAARAETTRALREEELPRSL